MARRKRASAEQPIGVGLTAKQMKRKKPLSAEYLVDIEPLTENQKRLFDSYKEQKHLVAYGCACLLYTSPSPRDKRQSRMPSSA